tara:strand:- start:250 stop:633 length:384 start_codon:yes stop_codon:yes gene_type:complete
MKNTSISSLLINKKFIKFIISGLVNTIICNAFLFILLEFTSIGVATLLSDILNSLIAYFLSSYGVFKKKGRVIKFIILIIFSWLLEWYSLEFLINKGYTKFISIICIAPFFATFSFLIQKYYVFKKK